MQIRQCRLDLVDARRIEAQCAWLPTPSMRSLRAWKSCTSLITSARFVGISRLKSL